MRLYKSLFSKLTFTVIMFSFFVNLPGFCFAQEINVTVTVDDQKEFQTMAGFGTTSRVFDDPHLFDNFDPATGRSETVMTTEEQDEILDILYVDLGLTRVRPATDGGLIEAVNDNEDAEFTDLSKFNFEWKLNDAHIDYVKRCVDRGVNTYFLSPITLEDWMTEDNPEEYVEWAMAIIMRWKEMGLELPYYSIMNEPGFSRGGIWSGEYIRDVIKQLGPKLRAEGLSTMIVAPDDLNASEAFDRLQIILDDPESKKYVGAIGFHLYDEPIENVEKVMELGEQHGLPLWMTEWSQCNPFAWANTMNKLISVYNVSAVDYIWGVFGEWESSCTHLTTLNYDGAEYLGFDINKHYYVVGQFSRYVKSGAVRIGVDSSNDAIRVSAFKNGSNIVIVAVNVSEIDREVQFDINSEIDLSMIKTIRTSTDEDWAELSSAVINASGFEMDLPGVSITTFVLGDEEPTSTPSPSPTSSPIFSVFSMSVEPEVARRSILPFNAKVTLLDHDGNPLVGVDVTSSTTGSGVVVNPDSMVTDSNGIAEFECKFLFRSENSTIIFSSNGLTATVTQK